jgi:hypothetical protein
MSYKVYELNAETNHWEFTKELFDHNDAHAYYTCMVGRAALVSNTGERIPEDFIIPEAVSIVT